MLVSSITKGCPPLRRAAFCYGIRHGLIGRRATASRSVSEPLRHTRRTHGCSAAAERERRSGRATGGSIAAQEQSYAAQAAPLLQRGEGVPLPISELFYFSAQRGREALTDCLKHKARPAEIRLRYFLKEKSLYGAASAIFFRT